MKGVAPTIFLTSVLLFGSSSAPAKVTTQSAPPQAERKVLYYQSPMHPWVKSDKPGQCTVCGMDLAPVYESPASHSPSGKGIVVLSLASRSASGIQVVDVAKRQLTRTLKVHGRIGEDENRRSTISSPVAGRIEALGMMSCEGDRITQRLPLFTINSPVLFEAANEYNLALAKGGDSLEKAKNKLLQYGLIPEIIAGIPSRQKDDTRFPIVATSSGTITKSYTARGKYVNEGDKLFDIVDLTRVWFTFFISEQDLPLVSQKQIVTIQTESLPGEAFKARISFINPLVDEMTRLIKVRVPLENPGLRLKNNISATGLVEIDAPEVLAVPRSAVLDSGKGAKVFVEKEPGVFELRNVELGLCGDDDWEVLGGLSENEKVVSAGNMLLDSQVQLTAMASTTPSGGTPAPIEDREQCIKYLEAVGVLVSALANDDLSAANAALVAMPAVPGEFPSLPAVPQPANDLATLRKAFLPWSEGIADWALARKKNLPSLKVFSCPMTQDLWLGAPTQAKWIQWSETPQNPYWGKKMPACGAEVSP
jgi:Cu(I)/Ag(I) efflux system membrane fusion protein